MTKMKKANEQRGHYGTRGKAKVSPPLPSRLSPPPFASFERLYSVRLPLDNSARGSSRIAKDFIDFLLLSSPVLRDLW